MRSIALINQKGGVGKTSTAVNLGASLASRGQRVLLLDLDPQANLSSWLLGDTPDLQTDTISEVLKGEVKILDAITPTTVPGLDLVPADLRLADTEKLMSTEYGAESILKTAIEDADFTLDPDDPSYDLYDYVLVDCPPSISLLTLNVMTFVDELIVPVQTEYLALNGLSNVARVLDKIQKRLNPDLRISGVLMVMVKSNTNLSKEVEASARKHFGELVYKITVRESVRVAECPSHGKPLLTYSPSCPATREYLALADEVLAQAEARRAERDYEDRRNRFRNRIRQQNAIDPEILETSRIKEIV